MNMGYIRSYQITQKHQGPVWLCSLTDEHPCTGATGLLHWNSSVLQSSVNTLQQVLLLRVHLFHFTVADAEELVVKFIESEKS